MPRWYAARQCFGRPEAVTQQVAGLVHQNNLGKVLPLIRFERRPRGRFYMFLAIESDEPGKLPSELEPFRAHPIIKELIPQDASSMPRPFTLDEIRSMVSGEIEVNEYARRLRVQLLDSPVFSDPFPGGDLDDEAVDDMLERSQRFDRLLLWLSAIGSGSRATFFTAAHSLGLARDGTEAGHLLRRLRLLGHLETGADGRRWSVAPAVLARVPAPAPWHAFVLCGERDILLLQAIRRAADVETTPQLGGAPACTLIRTADPDRLIADLHAASLPRPPRLGAPALRLAELLPPLRRWPDLLPALQLQPELYDWRRFDGECFVEVPWEGQFGFYERWPRGVRADRPLDTLVYDPVQDRFLRGDWYGLRCLSRLQEGVTCPAHYDLLSARLVLPEAWRPPEIYERALVLASGRLPERRPPWLLYDDIEPALVAILTDKLNLTLGGIDPNA